MNVRSVFWIALLIPVFGEGAEKGIRFVDIAVRAGIQFNHYNGAAGKKWLPETLGSGCAFVDLDNDGWADLFLLNGKDWTPSGRKHFLAFYHNNQNGTFSDVTKGSGLDVEMYANGVA